VFMHSLFADTQGLANLSIASALCHEQETLKLAPGQARLLPLPAPAPSYPRAPTPLGLAAFPSQSAAPLPESRTIPQLGHHPRPDATSAGESFPGGEHSSKILT
jgi:hypothetical protein